ncbi:hypothetical protein [Natronogracilivirga saccharolytica]|uniref:Curlin associated repeat-containing protein n=1 Tax=Natronogracilivirga saccharolytica TaxID=2812953 RepID=A0A8J7RMR9_9BACT|nr:hypothetical protein [Natronogracilivirga saccharolytica]MBP3193830.1 hypothetical protein [Natronogracilivirga saccharolytica]
MKNITTLLVLILFTAGMAVAQNNEASVAQNGNDNDATIDQVGADHEASITQVSSRHDGTIDQEGEGHQASLTQEDGKSGYSGQDYQVGTITQRGLNQIANVIMRSDRLGSNATVDQDGADNEVYLRQQHSGNYTATLTQDGSDNYIWANQRESFSQYLNVLQEGDNNRFFGSLGSGSSNTEVTQSSDDNLVVIQQGRHSGAGAGAEAIIEQSVGNGNIVELTQGSDETALFTQEGNSNMIEGPGSGFDWGFGSVADLETDEGSARQRGGAFAEVDQFGDYNTLWLDQDGASDATVLQDGDWNSASVYQSGDNNIANITSDGSYNTASIRQQQ